MSQRLFIVEDHPIMRESYQALFEALTDLKVCGMAASAEEALGLLPETPCDLVLVDISLPGIDGLELVRRISAAWPEMKTLVITGHSERRYEVEAMQAGANGFVQKGDPTFMLESIHAVLAS